MFELLGAVNLGFIANSISAFVSSIVLAEIYDRLNVKTVLTFQRGVSRIRKNIIRVTKKMSKKGSSGVILNLGKRVFHLHHSRAGLALLGAAVIFSNIYILFFSLGLVIHHIIREKKLF